MLHIKSFRYQKLLDTLRPEACESSISAVKVWRGRYSKLEALFQLCFLRRIGIKEDVISVIMRENILLWGKFGLQPERFQPTIRHKLQKIPPYCQFNLQDPSLSSPPSRGGPEPTLDLIRGRDGVFAHACVMTSRSPPPDCSAPWYSRTAASGTLAFEAKRSILSRIWFVQHVAHRPIR